MVDPFSIAAAVFAAISAFKDGQDLWRKWRSRRKIAKAQAAHSDELDRAWVDSPSRIEREYNVLKRIRRAHTKNEDFISVTKAILRSVEKFHRTALEMLRLAVGRDTSVNVRNLLSATLGLRDDATSSICDVIGSSASTSLSPELSFHAMEVYACAERGNRAQRRQTTPQALCHSGYNHWSSLGEFQVPPGPDINNLESSRIANEQIRAVSGTLREGHTRPLLLLDSSSTITAHSPKLDLNNLESSQIVAQQLLELGIT